MTPRLWLTYAWGDNEDCDIDFIVQELDEAGIDVLFDRRNLIPGRRLWTQIGGSITDPNQCDAWGIVVTANSLASEACIEELCYAVERALRSTVEDFPIIGFLHGVSASALPPALKVRLCIPLGNNDWVNQAVAAVEGRAPGLAIKGLDQWVLREHHTDGGTALEIRPRFDRIAPFAVAIDVDEKTSGNVTHCSPGPANQVPTGHVTFKWIDSETTLTDGTRAWVWGADNEANATTSYYLFYKQRPKRIWFGHQQNLKKLEFQ